MATLLLAPNLQLPWSSTIEDDRRFWRIVGILLIPFFILSIAIPLINVPVPDREELEELPPQLAKLVLEQQVLPKPTPVPTPVPTPEPKEEEKPKDEEKPKEKPTPEPEPEPQLKKAPEPAKLVEQARAKAQAEINQFADALSDMRDSFDLSEVNEELTQSTGKAAQIDRSVIAGQAKTGSGGIKTSKLSRNTGGVALSGKKTTAVDSKLASATGAGAEAKKQKARGGNRSEEHMRKVMDKNKSAMFSIYNRALRKDPTLEGKVVFDMIIEPNGRISSAKIVSSDLNNPALEAKLLSRIKLINFGAQEVKQTKLIFSFDFLPY